MFQWDEVMNSLPWGVVVISSDHRVIGINAKIIEWFSSTRQDLLGQTCEELLGKGLCQIQCPLADKTRWVGIANITRSMYLDFGAGEAVSADVKTLPWKTLDQKIIGCIHIISLPPKQLPRQKIEDIPNLSEFGLLGSSSLMHEISYLIRSVAPTDSTVLVQGETGTGKEIAAQIIHKLSGRKKEAFVSLNCAALPENLIESELFGHEKGAFTGADKESKGYFETAHRGTIFLDEIAETSLFFQAKLLRVLQSGEYQRLGSTQPKKTDARIIAATNKDLVSLVKNNQFREDLYYRLSVFPIKMPPLRDRIADLTVLVNHFIEDFAARMNKPIEGITEVALTLLFQYNFPGNVRELKNLVEYAFIKCNDHLIGPTDLPERIRGCAPYQKKQQTVVAGCNVLEVLTQCNQNKAKAARTLGISRKTLYQKLARIKNKDLDD